MENVKWILPTSNFYIEYKELYLVTPNGKIELVKVYNDKIYDYSLIRVLGEFYNPWWYHLNCYYLGMRVGTIEKGYGLFNSFEEALIVSRIDEYRKRTIYYIYVDDDGTLQKSDIGELINKKWVVHGTDAYWDIEPIEEFIKEYEQQKFDVISDFHDVITVYHKHYRPDGRNLVRV